MARMQRPWRLRGSASDSNLRSGKGEWFRLLRSLRQRFPRPIPIFVAAEKMARLQNTLQRAVILDFRPRLENRCTIFPRFDPGAASILDFRLRLVNRCKLFPDYTLLRASILDFKAKLGNRCKDFPENNLLCASILDFRPRLGNRCKVFPVYTLFRASILDFMAKLENRCRGEWFRLLQPSLPPQRSASDSNLRSGNEE